MNGEFAGKLVVFRKSVDGRKILRGGVDVGSIVKDGPLVWCLKIEGQKARVDKYAARCLSLDEAKQTALRMLR